MAFVLCLSSLRDPQHQQHDAYCRLLSHVFEDCFDNLSPAIFGVFKLIASRRMSQSDDVRTPLEEMEPSELTRA